MKFIHLSDLRELFGTLAKTQKPKRLGSVEQDSTMGPNFAYRSFCPSWNLVGECLPQTLLCSAKRKRYG